MPDDSEPHIIYYLEYCIQRTRPHQPRIITVTIYLRVLRKRGWTEPRATSAGYGDFAERGVAISVKCEGESLEVWEAIDGSVSFREAALTLPQYFRTDTTRMPQ